MTMVNGASLKGTFLPTIMATLTCSQVQSTIPGFGRAARLSRLSWLAQPRLPAFLAKISYPERVSYCITGQANSGFLNVEPDGSLPVTSSLAVVVVYHDRGLRRRRWLPMQP